MQSLNGKEVLQSLTELHIMNKVAGRVDAFEERPCVSCTLSILLYYASACFYSQKQQPERKARKEWKWPLLQNGLWSALTNGIVQTVVLMINRATLIIMSFLTVGRSLTTASEHPSSSQPVNRRSKRRGIK